MIDQRKRQTLTIMSAGALATTVPSTVFAFYSDKDLRTMQKITAYSGTTLLSEVVVTISTLGSKSAITTLSNNSNKVVTITQLNPRFIEHRHQRYDISAALGKAGVTLKPGQKRMITTKRGLSVAA